MVTQSPHQSKVLLDYPFEQRGKKRHRNDEAMPS